MHEGTGPCLELKFCENTGLSCPISAAIRAWILISRLKKTYIALSIVWIAENNGKIVKTEDMGKKNMKMINSRHASDLQSLLPKWYL